MAEKETAGLDEPQMATVDLHPSETHSLKAVIANAALVATTFAFVTVAVRAVIVARLDVTTALALVRTSGPVNVFVGTLTAELAAFLLGVYELIWIWVRYFSPRRASRLLVAYSGLAVIGIIVLFVGSWLSASLVLAMAGSLFVVRDLRLSTAERPFVIFNVALVAAIGLAWFGIFFLSSSVWLPQEKITLRSGDVSYGYVLEDEGRWTTMLGEADREILWIEGREVADREPCDAFSGRARTSLGNYLVGLIADSSPPPSYPGCP